MLAENKIKISSLNNSTFRGLQKSTTIRRVWEGIPKKQQEDRKSDC